MTKRKPFRRRRVAARALLCTLLCPLPFLARAPLTAQPSPAATAAFNAYASRIELRLARQHQAPGSFLVDATAPASKALRLHGEERILENLTPSAEANLPGAMLHHWRGTAFVPGARAADFERLMKNFSAYPRIFSPQVLEAAVTAQSGDHLQATMRVRQQHILTVVLDTAYEVTFAHLDPEHGFSISRSTRIHEIEAPGTGAEQALSASQEHGFLWRQNTYWSYEQRDGGIYLQIESLSLTRSIPTGLGWAVKPFVESVPRESLEFTLRSVCNALRR